MPDAKVTIDGKEVLVPANGTILDAAKIAGVDIPVLCAHPALDAIGSCRVCLVEVEKQRVLQPACTFPVSDGMVVHTDTPPVKDSRRFVLQLLFSERNHFCMYCQMSGSCDL
ncbi:MAG: 2Fe-2S iron-sulfur cluster-binding protein, partial [Chloroflexota bacterium]